MSPHQVVPIHENQKPVVVALLKDMRAALSYLSFYSADSHFVSQAVSMFHTGLTHLLAQNDSLVFQAGDGVLILNGAPCEDTEVIVRTMWARSCPGFSIARGVLLAESTSFLRMLASSKTDPRKFQDELGSGKTLPHYGWVTTVEVGGEAPASIVLVPGPEPVLTSAYSDSPVLTVEDLHNAPDTGPSPDLRSMLVLVAEGWQLSRQVQHHLVETPQARAFLQLFRRFFAHFLDRISTVSGEMESIQGWFKIPEGDEVKAPMEDAMRDLLAVAVEKGYTDVLYDPAAAGLVSECLAHWGATGQHDLVEQTVGALARGLQRDVQDRELALTHLMDSRPWVSNSHLVGVILDRLTAQLSEETNPGLYQKGLLIAWDLLEPAVEANLETQVLSLLSTLHLHADDEAPLFRERPALVRQWILGKSRPELIRSLVALAHRRRRLGSFPILASMAAPLLLNDFYAAGPEEVPGYLKIFAEMREQVQAALMERLPVSTEEMEVRLLLLIVHTCGVDAGLSLQISAWMAKGSRELKESIISTIEEVGEPGGGPALRLALLDDDEGIAMEAARVLSKIGFKPAVPLMIKAVKIRKDHGKPVESFHPAVCKALGVFALPETLSYLMEQTRKKTLWGSGSPLAVREAAARALVHFVQPEASGFLDALLREGDTAILKAVEEERGLLTQVETPAE